MSPDPRPAVISRRLQGVRRLLAVTGGKGGIGKSVVSSLLALCLARAGARAGLLDLDFTGPCDHLVLGFGAGLPAEESGLVPPLEHGIRCLSIAHFVGATATPLRGEEASSMLVELLAVVRWGELDYLIVDLPPGLGDIPLEAVRLLPRGQFLVVATPSAVAVGTVQRTLELLGQVRAPVIGVLENMRRRAGTMVARMAARAGVPFWGSLPFDARLEEALGRPERLAQTKAYAALEAIVRAHLLG